MSSLKQKSTVSSFNLLIQWSYDMQCKLFSYRSNVVIVSKPGCFPWPNRTAIIQQRSGTFTFRTFSWCFCPKRLTVIHTYIHTLLAVAAMQDTDHHIRSSWGFNILSEDTLTCRSGESNQQTSNNKTLALPLSHSRSCTCVAVLLQQSCCFGRHWLTTYSVVKAGGCVVTYKHTAHFIIINVND